MSSSSPSSPLLSLPDEILAQVLAALSSSTADLLSLRSVHPRLRALADDEALWRLKCVRELNVPSLGTARRAGRGSAWRRLYFGVRRACAYTWGENSTGRLAMQAMRLHPRIHTVTAAAGVPFPLKLDVVRALREDGLEAEGSAEGSSSSHAASGASSSSRSRSAAAERLSAADIGVPVSMQASGWGFSVLTSTGRVASWGQLHEVDDDHRRPVPQLVRLPPGTRVASLACGRQHAVALAHRTADASSAAAATAGAAAAAPAGNTQRNFVLEWRSWAYTLLVTDADGSGPDTAWSAQEVQHYLAIADADEARERRGGASASSSSGGGGEPGAGFGADGALFADSVNSDSSRAAPRFDELHREILQVEAGWDFSVSLVSVRARCSATGRVREVGREAFLWKMLWLSARTEDDDSLIAGGPHAQRDAQIGFERRFVERAAAQMPKPITCAFKPIRLRTLPGAVPMPAVLGSSASGSASAAGSWLHADKVAQLAAGDTFVAALTERGGVYALNIDIRDGMFWERPPVIYDLTGHTMATRDHRNSEGARRWYRGWMGGALAHDDPQPAGALREWKRLDCYCAPARVRDELQRAGVDLANIETGTGPEGEFQITHISAHFNNFAAYSVPAADGHAAAEPEPDSAQPRKQGVVLLSKGGGGGGVDDVGIASAPQVLPALQGAGVIKVSFGDWHTAALTGDGRVLTFGQWSKGALGIWDSLPFSEDTGLRGARAWTEGPLERVGDAPTPTRPDGPFGGPVSWLVERMRRGQDEGGTNLHPLPRMTPSPRGPGRIVRHAAPMPQPGPTPMPVAPPGAAEGSGSQQPQSSQTDSGTAGATDDHDEEKQHMRWLNFVWSRLRPRQIPEQVAEPTRVLFDEDFDMGSVTQKRPEDPTGAFVFDIALSGWHSGALVLGNTQPPASEQDQVLAVSESVAALKIDTAVATPSQGPTGQASPGQPSTSYHGPAQREPGPSSTQLSNQLAASPISTHGSGGEAPPALSPEQVDQMLGVPNAQRARAPRRPLPHQRPPLRAWSAEEMHRRGVYLTSAFFAAFCIIEFGLLGGFEALFLGTGKRERGTFMDLPFNVLYFLPLLIPMTVYLVIARWTGESYFVYS